MKTHLIIIAALLLSSSIQAQEITGDYYYKSSGIHDISWRTVGYGARCFAVNSKGQIFGGTWGVLRSADNGEHWILKQLPNTSYEVMSIAINSKDTLFTTTYDGKLYRSADDGITWSQLMKDSTRISFKNVAVNSREEIYTGTDKGLFLLSNKGESLKATGWHEEVEKLIINKSDAIFILSNLVYRSNDYGKNWTKTSTGLTNTGINAFTFNSSGDIFAGTAASNGGVFTSKDNGDHWTTTRYSFLGNNETDSVVIALACSPGNEIFIGTFGKGVHILSSEGTTVTPAGLILPYFQPVIYSFIFTPDGHILAGTSDEMYKSQQIITGVPAMKIIPPIFSVGQNFPNPFRNQTHIGFSLPMEANVNITIFNQEGHMIKTLINKMHNRGYHSISWDADNVTPGIYYYRVTADKYSVTRKMLLISSR